jgi:hypothetical protein
VHPLRRDLPRARPCAGAVRRVRHSHPDEDYPWAPTEGETQRDARIIEETWGHDFDLTIVMPSADRGAGDWRDSRVDEGRYIADRIPGARFVELSGEDHVPFHDPDQILDEIEEFLTGVRPPALTDRGLATVLAGAGESFVSSTTHDLVAGSGLGFEDRGEHVLKGVDGTRRVYAAAG